MTKLTTSQISEIKKFYVGRQPVDIFATSDLCPHVTDEQCDDGQYRQAKVSAPDPIGNTGKVTMIVGDFIYGEQIAPASMSSRT